MPVVRLGELAAGLPLVAGHDTTPPQVRTESSRRLGRAPFSGAVIAPDALISAISLAE